MMTTDRAHRDNRTPASCAVRAASTPEESSTLEAYLGDLDAQNVDYFADKDDDALNDALCAGRYYRVVFVNLDALLTMVWKQHGTIDRWLAAGVQIDIAAPSDADDSWRRILPQVYHSLHRHRRMERHREILAAVLLSALGLLAVLAILAQFLPAK